MSDRDIYVVAVDGLESRPLDTLNANVLRAAARAINKTSDKARTLADRAIRQQVRFAASYLSPSQGRLNVTSYAREDELAATVTARTRPTSLARFASGTPESTRKAGGVRVEVAPGFAKFMKRAFLIRLPAGRGTATESAVPNQGLAIRLRAGETIHNKRITLQRVKGQGNLYLLFGPSVSQVFNTVREDIGHDISDALATEFNRLIQADLPA